MIFKEFCGEKLPALGLGTMRLPQAAEGVVDEVATAEMVEFALANGVNYFDTAWFYHGGESENVMGRVLSKYPRESYFLASKVPGIDLANMEKIGVKTVICTDISKDGAMMGTNLDLYKDLKSKYNIDIVASGGVSSMDDITALKKMDLYGAILGKALYEGAVDLTKAIEVAK